MTGGKGTPWRKRHGGIHCERCSHADQALKLVDVGGEHLELLCPACRDRLKQRAERHAASHTRGSRYVKDQEA